MAEQLLSVAKFREYLRINTVQPDPDYGRIVGSFKKAVVRLFINASTLGQENSRPAINFLREYAKELGLPWKTFECIPKKPIFVMTWPGRDPSLTSVMLNSHMDVVPVFADMWTHDPFGAEKTPDGNIYARGSQDMKSVGIQYLEAIRELQLSGESPLRTVHVTFVPDEEIGGADGMQAFIETDHFRQLNVGFALDEGLANPGSSYRVFPGQRYAWWCTIRCGGNPGHGSQFVPNTAGEKVSKILQEVFAFRQKEENRLKADPSLSLGDVTTMNVTFLKGGVQHNVIPAAFEIGLDIRITPTVDPVAFERLLLQWCAAAGDNVTLDFVIRENFEMGRCLLYFISIATPWHLCFGEKSFAAGVTPTTSDYPWWKAFEDGCKAAGITIQKEIFPAATDSRYLRGIGLPALDFSPINNTPILLHDHDEYLNEEVFLRGIRVYVAIFRALANVQG